MNYQLCRDENGNEYSADAPALDEVMVTLADGATVPQSKIKEHHERVKAAAEAQRKAAAEKPKITTTCPFRSGSNNMLCMESCALRTAHGCALKFKSEGHPAASTVGTRCPFSPYACTENCEMFIGGCAFAGV